MRVPKIFKIDAKNAFGSISLVVNPLVWYSAVILYLQDILSKMTSVAAINNAEASMIWGVHFSGIIFAALLGSFVAKRIQKERFLVIWMALGTISSFLLFAISQAPIFMVVLIVFLLGVSLGIGMPTCMGYYTDCISIENRGRISGIVMFITGLGIFALTAFPSDNLIILSFALAGWRLVGLLVFYKAKPLPVNRKEENNPSYRSILGQKSFVLYLIPWVMFSLVNYLGGTVQMGFLEEQAAVTISMVQNVLMGVFAVIGGFLLDLVGRKRIAICGFVMLGIDTAILGVFPNEIWSSYLTTVFDGVAWGFLFVIFIATIWGDLSQSFNSSKYYAVGVLPLFVSKLLELTVSGSVVTYIVSEAGKGALFSFVAFFLFIAVLPLVYAPETLPEKVMRERDLQSYVEKALSKAQKETDVSEKQDSKNKNEEIEFELNNEESNEEYEQAAIIAEKYY